ncbi:hypothetical protein [Hydrogenivirga sp. 128-5-R1-1]|uniref:hypothetical protein n=1 Tax=Hydrogenivirga sp. 128-5-R1-1 TaxID=392423 RepID=UPI00015F1A4D|nr:hypothetical protein [Hydrogenivirga sp. 128-5-R1-1]EDP73320.1 hypothetical protein HG1285_10747 [Hydrogenivirga sp. 128-5-R1-1]
MEPGVRKEVEENFKKVLEKIKDIFDIEKENLNFEKLEGIGKIVIQYEELYDQWIEYIETLSLPDIEKIEKIEHSDGPYLKINYKLQLEEGKLIRKIRIKSNGKVNIYHNIVFNENINNTNYEIIAEYDTYGNLTFYIERKNK